MIGGTIGQIIAGIMLGIGFKMIGSCISVIINSLFGIWLLRYDEHFGRIHNFFVTTCCQDCEQQCGGGMSCLMPFVFTNVITLVIRIFGGELQGYYVGLTLLESWSWFAVLCAFVSFVGMIVGSVVGFLAFREHRDTGLSSVAGDPDW